MVSPKPEKGYIAVAPLTLEEVKDRLDVNENQVVEEEGPFYGQPAYVPAFWLASGRGTDRSLILNVEITPEHRVEWPDLHDRPGAVLILACTEGRVVPFIGWPKP